MPYSHITFLEEFAGNDWSKYSKIASKFTCILCGFVGGVTALFSNALVGVWTVLCAMVLAIWEFPRIFIFVSNFEQVKVYLEDNLQCKHDEFKACLFFFISLFCFINSTICILAGLALIATSVLLIFAAINRRVDEYDMDTVGQYQYRDLSTPEHYQQQQQQLSGQQQHQQAYHSAINSSYNANYNSYQGI